MTFEQLIRGRKTGRTEAERVLLQCIATLTTLPPYTSMTPWEVFDEQKRLAEGLYQD